MRSSEDITPPCDAAAVSKDAIKGYTCLDTQRKQMIVSVCSLTCVIEERKLAGGVEMGK